MDLRQNDTNDNIDKMDCRNEESHLNLKVKDQNCLRPFVRALTSPLINKIGVDLGHIVTSLRRSVAQKCHICTIEVVFSRRGQRSKLVKNILFVWVRQCCQIVNIFRLLSSDITHYPQMNNTKNSVIKVMHRFSYKQFWFISLIILEYVRVTEFSTAA